MKKILAFLLFIIGVQSFAQTTIGKETKPELSEGTPISSKKHKILLVPFEPKMYMSEIDHKINAETKWNQKQIRAYFRDAIDEQFYKKLKSHFDVVSLLEDTVKYKKDMFHIYHDLSYKYDKIPNQEKYEAPKHEKEKPGIKNGQIVVEINSDARFMNSKISNPKIFTELYSKFKTDLFLFVNQIDIHAGTSSTSDFGAAGQRTITVHYTVFNLEAKEINSGVCAVKFPVEVNSPSKIASSYLSVIGEEIAKRIERALAPKIK